MDGFFVRRYIHITYVQSYYMMVNKDIVCLQKIQEEKNEIDQIYGFFFNILKLFLFFFNFFTEKSIILSWLIQITAKFIQTEQLKC